MGDEGDGDEEKYWNGGALRDRGAGMIEVQ